MLNLKPYLRTLMRRPDAFAFVRGSNKHPHIAGQINFYRTRYGVLVATEVFGLPSPVGMCKSPVFGFHLHSGNACTGTESDPFANAMTHYNPNNCPHPHHSGDLPPLFGNNGYAFSIFMTNRFAINEIIGKTVIIHSMPDDFTTQPAGNSGEKMACGIIVR